MQNSGLAGELNPLAGVTAGGPNAGGYGGALGQVFRRNYPTYSVGVQMTLPLRNRVAQADAVRDELQLRQAQIPPPQLEDHARLALGACPVVRRPAPPA